MIGIYTKNFLKSLDYCSYQKIEQLNHLFASPKNAKEGSYLRFWDDSGKINILEVENVDKHIEYLQKGVPEDILRETGFQLIPFIYNGDDYEKKYLIDNGFFVLDEKHYEEIKKGYKLYKYETRIPYGTPGVADKTIYLTKESLYKLKENILKKEECREQTRNFAKKLEKRLNEFDSRYGDNQYLKPGFFADLKEQPVPYKVLPSDITLMIWIVTGVIIAFSLFMAFSIFESGGLDGLPFILQLICFGNMFISHYEAIEIVYHFVGKYENKKLNEEIELVNKLNEFNDKCDKEMLKESANDEKALGKKFQMMMDNSEEEEAYDEGVLANDEGYVYYSIGDLNQIICLLMYCGFPYVFADGNIARPVSAVDKYLFSTMDTYFEMIDQYLAYMNEFVYPMIRKNGLRGDMDLISLNNYLIEDLREQMRTDQIAERIDRVQSVLENIQNDNRKILSNMKMIEINMRNLSGTVRESGSRIEARINSASTYYPISLS